MSDCDILVVGAGHNALVCAAYIAQAGYKVIVLERRHKAGRAVVTDTAMRQRAAELGAKIQAEDGVARAVELVHQYDQKRVTSASATLSN